MTVTGQLGLVIAEIDTHERKARGRWRDPEALLRRRIDELREQARFLLDEAIDLETTLPWPPSPKCLCGNSPRDTVG